MAKLKLPNIDDVVAIDIHTHAEEPCGMHGDDGYDDFQAQMADYFKSPHKHPPTVPGERIQSSAGVQENISRMWIEGGAIRPP